MPIYEYRRQNGTTFEVVQSMSDEPLTADPDTGKPVTRVMHAPAVHFKGSGFYNTDYGTKKRARETEKAASDGADKTAAKAKESKAAKDAKPAGANKPAKSDPK